MIISRHWGMPSADTFDCPPISGFVSKYMNGSKVSIDPFARNKRIATFTNDINPSTSAQQHLEARAFLKDLVLNNVKADVILFDPPYSPRQITESYANAGMLTNGKDTQNAVLYSECRKYFRELIKDGGWVLSFGWNSVGMGKGFEIVEIIMVCHGGAHNDTICMAERKVPEKQSTLQFSNEPQKDL